MKLQFEVRGVDDQILGAETMDATGEDGMLKVPGPFRIQIVCRGIFARITVHIPDLDCTVECRVPHVGHDLEPGHTVTCNFEDNVVGVFK